MISNEIMFGRFYKELPSLPAHFNQYLASSLSLLTCTTMKLLG